MTLGLGISFPTFLYEKITVFRQSSTEGILSVQSQQVRPVFQSPGGRSCGLAGWLGRLPVQTYFYQGQGLGGYQLYQACKSVAPDMLHDTSLYEGAKDSSGSYKETQSHSRVNTFFKKSKTVSVLKRVEIILKSICPLYVNNLFKISIDSERTFFLVLRFFLR